MCGTSPDSRLEIAGKKGVGGELCTLLIFCSKLIFCWLKIPIALTQGPEKLAKLLEIKRQCHKVLGEMRLIN
jgi:hypothetical protein